MKSRLLMTVSLLLVLCFGVLPKGNTTLTGDQALQKLVEGNNQYKKMALLRPNQTRARRSAVAKEQNPFAIILSCADSRVPPEMIFDQGLGDIFVIRVAGNIA